MRRLAVCLLLLCPACSFLLDFDQLQGGGAKPADAGTQRETNGSADAGTTRSGPADAALPLDPAP